MILFLLGLILVLLVITVASIEGFSADFIKEDSSTETFQYVDMGDHRTLVYMQRGDSDETVLLLHNSPMNLTLWKPLFHTMQRISMSGVKTPNLIAYDLRGHGSAWMPVDPKYNDLNVDNHAWTLSQYINDCKKIHDEIIGGKRIKICGFGFGGMIAQKYALTYPDLIDALIILQTTIRPMPGLQDEIDYLGGPNGWIAKNPNVTYLTSEERFVKKTLCEWFYLPENNCPDDPFVDKNDVINDEVAPQYNLTASLWREGSSTTTLQADKLLVSTDLIEDWIEAPAVPFKVHILAAMDDPLAPPEMMTHTYTTIYNNNRHVLVVFDIVNGRHGFTIMRPDYIAGIICDECKNISSTDTFDGKAIWGF